MGILISFPRGLTLAAFSGLASYHETMESQMQSAAEAEKLIVEESIRKMGLSAEKEMQEWDLAMQNHDMRFNMLMPNFLRYSLIVLLFLVVENKLGELANVAAQTHPKSPKVPNPKGRVIETYKRYFTEEVGISSLDWQTMHELNAIRNCIVHTSGKVKGRPDETRLRNIANKHKGLSVSNTRQFSRIDLHPLYLEDDMLVIEPSYCSYIIDRAKHFFEQLCDALQLPGLITETDS